MRRKGKQNMELCTNIRVLTNGKKQRVWSLGDVAKAKVAILSLLEQGLSYMETLKKFDLPMRTVMQWRETDIVFSNACLKFTTQKAPVMVKKRQPKPSGAGVLPAKKEFTKDEAVDTKKEFLNGLLLGLPIDYALMLGSATRETLREWMLEDESFMIEVNKAQAKNLAWWIQKIRTGAETDWKAALAYLERVYPHLFAEVKQVEIINKYDKDKELINVTKENNVRELEQKRNTIKGMTDEQLVELMNRSEAKNLNPYNPHKRVMQ